MKHTAHVTGCLEQIIPKLLGLTITGAVVDDSGEYWGFTAKGKVNGKTVEKTVFVMADPEGNGPGWLEVNEGIEPDPPAYTEWCPHCGAEAGYEENRPFPCPACGNLLRPCYACYMQGGAECAKCPWEAQRREGVCLKH